MRQLYLALLFDVAKAYEERGEYERSIEALRRVVAEEPILEEAHAGLMRLHALSDQRGQALAQHERLKESLARRLGAEPGATSRRLREDIAASELRSPIPTSDPPQDDKGETPDAGKHNLPSQRTSFVGRELGRRETTSPEGVGVVQCWQLCLGSGRVRDSEESLALFRELEDKRGIVSALTMLGAVAMLGQQDLETVPVLYGEAMSLKEEVENPRARLPAAVLRDSGGGLGRLWGRAEALFEESLALCREIRDVQGVRICLTNLGLASVTRGEHARATALFREYLRVVSELDNAALLHNFVGLACATAAQGRPVCAARLWGAAKAIQEGSALRITPMTHYRINYDERLCTARAQGGEPPRETSRRGPGRSRAGTSPPRRC